MDLYFSAPAVLVHTSTSVPEFDLHLLATYRQFGRRVLDSDGGRGALAFGEGVAAHHIVEVGSFTDPAISY
jgi:hypothetical protein